MSDGERLVDYFFVCGLHNDGPLPEDSGGLLPVHVIDRYPEVDYSDLPFPNGVSMFCFPDGGARVCLDIEMANFYEFVSTMENGSLLYGYVLRIYESLDVEALGNELRKTLPQSMASETQTQFYVPKCLCILSHWPFRSQFRTFLTTLYRISISTVVQPLERIVSNFVSEVPLPPPGMVKVQYHVGDAELDFTRPALNNPLSFHDVGFQQIFECLDLDNVLRVFSAILTERQIVIRSSQLSLLSACGEVFRTLMYPFTWSHVYIPIVPAPMLMVLHAPLPFIIGVHESTLRLAAKEGFSIPLGAVTVDLDRNKVFPSTQEASILPLPLHDERKLKARLEACAPAFAQRSSDWKEVWLPRMDSAILHAARPSEVNESAIARARSVAQSGEDFDPHSGKSVWSLLPDGSCNWPMVRTAFFRFFTSILKDYNEFLTYPVQKPDTADLAYVRSSLEQRQLASGSFNVSGFLSKRKKASERAFMSAFLQTQHFQRFVDDILHPDGARDADVVFFEQSLSAKFKRSFFGRFVSKTETSFLKDESFAVSRTVVATGPDTSPLGLESEQWMPAGDGRTGYERFPRLQAALYGQIRPMPDMGSAVTAKQKAWSLLSRKRAKNTSILEGNQETTSASDAVFTTWFALYTSSIGRVTEYLSHYDLSADQAQVASSRDPSPRGRPQQRTIRPASPKPRRRKSSLSAQLDIDATRQEAFLWQLDTVFDVLDTAGEQWDTSLNESVYRWIIEACGRCGHTDYAMRVLGMMHEANIKVDSLIYSNLVQSFSMNGDVRHSLKLDILNWENLRKEVQAANKRIAQSSQNRRSSRPQTRGTSRLLRARHQSEGLSDQCLQVEKATTVDSKTIADQPGFSSWSYTQMSNRDARGMIDNWGSRGGVLKAVVPGTSNKLKSAANRAATSTSAFRSLLFGSKTPQSQNNVMGTFTNGPTNQSVPSESPSQKIALSKKEPLDLDFIFPKLVLDTERETCPQCSEEMLDEEIRFGWNAGDPNDYNTICPRCQRKYVAFFTCFSPETDWVGSTGPGTPLFCEFLPPWVLCKEVRTILANHDIHFVCADSFRRERGTLFWNLVLYFCEFDLPVDFFVGPTRYATASPSPSGFPLDDLVSVVDAPSGLLRVDTSFEEAEKDKVLSAVEPQRSSESPPKSRRHRSASPPRLRIPRVNSWKSRSLVKRASSGSKDSLIIPQNVMHEEDLVPSAKRLSFSSENEKKEAIRRRSLILKSPGTNPDTDTADEATN